MISWGAFLPGSKQTRRPADTEVHFCDAPTTTLPSEGHQNVLVNAAFVLPWGGGGDRPRMCLYSPNNSPRWGLGQGWKGLMWYFKGAAVHLHASPSGLTRCESLQRGSMLHAGMWHTGGELKLRRAAEDGWVQDMRAGCKNGFCLAEVWTKSNECK